MRLWRRHDRADEVAARAAAKKPLEQRQEPTEAGAKMVDVSRKVGVSTQTMARWREKYSGMTVPDAKEKRRLEDENARLKKLVAQFALEVDSLKVALGNSGDYLRAAGGGQTVRVARSQRAPCVRARGSSALYVEVQGNARR